MRHRTLPTTVAALIAMATTFVALALPTAAEAEVLCTTRYRTAFPDGDESIEITSGSASSDGRAFTFRSSGDPFGTNADRSLEIWHLDGNELTQVTSTTSAVSHGLPRLDDDGSLVVFDSTADLQNNSDGNREVFAWEAADGSFTNLSTTVGGGDSANNARAVSGNGNVVVYTSNQNPFGQNADGNQELFTRLIGGARDQITQTTGGNTDIAATDDDGSVIVFRSNRNLETENFDLNFELYRTDLTGTSFEQITQSAGVTGVQGTVLLDGDGSTALAESTADPLGQNPDERLQVLVLDTATEAVSQPITNPGAGGPTSLGISDDGTRISTRLQANPTGQNPALANRTFLFDVAGQQTTQLDFAAGTLGSGSLSAGGGQLLASNSTQAFGPNPDGGAEVTETSCSSTSATFADVSTSHPFFDEIGWMASARISTGFQPGPTYQPSAAVSRAAMSAFMYRLAGEPAFADPATPTFGDVAGTHPFFTEIEWMAAEGITTGTPASPKPRYKPSDPVSRGAMSAFMYRLAGSPSFSEPVTPTFSDVAAAHPFFTEIEWMADEEITTGFQPGPTYQPGAAVSRQAMSAFMFRLAAGPGVDLS